MSTWTVTSAVWTAKLVWYSGAAAIFSYLDIPQEQIAILGILMVIDFLTWVGKQYRIDPKKITSHDAWIWVIKKVATLISVLSVAFVLKGNHIDGDVYIGGILGILIMAEGYSVIQNVYAIRTGEILPEFDAISIILKGFSEFLKAKIESAINQKTSEKPDDKNTP
jgi:phage-related holin